jgi:hypothetical protein
MTEVTLNLTNICRLPMKTAVSPLQCPRILLSKKEINVRLLFWFVANLNWWTLTNLECGSVRIIVEIM